MTKKYNYFTISTDGVYNLKSRLTKRSNTVYTNSTFSYIFITKKAAENNLAILKAFGYSDAYIITHTKERQLRC